MSTRRDCSGGPNGLGSRRIVPLRGQAFYPPTTRSYKTGLSPRTIQGIQSQHRVAREMDKRRNPALPLSVKNSRVIELHDTNHYVFVVDEALIVREMRKFLLDE
jgi:hypothetical protein